MILIFGLISLSTLSLSTLSLSVFVVLAATSTKLSVIHVTSEPDTPRILQLMDLEHVAVLGSGTFGRVSLVQDPSNSKLYALKAMLKSEIVAHKQQNNVLNEKNVMMCCNHPFIIRLYATFKDERKLYMLLEFVQGGELFAIIHTAKRDGENYFYCLSH